MVLWGVLHKEGPANDRGIGLYLHYTDQPACSLHDPTFWRKLLAVVTQHPGSRITMGLYIVLIIICNIKILLSLI